MKDVSFSIFEQLIKIRFGGDRRLLLLAVCVTELSNSLVIG